jgi:hypothetical protein
VGGLDNHGHPVNISSATAITYDLCLRSCGAASRPFILSSFFNQCSTWLLPWLALVSQLHFDATDTRSNLESMLLTIGSPALAAYSLALTVLGRWWMAKRFAAHNCPTNRYATQIVSSLQQSPLTVTKTGSLLASLVVLPENDEWWSELAMRLDYTHTWSVTTVTSIAWVVIAYVLTLIASFTDDLVTSMNLNGQGVRYLWLWLLPIVIGWLQLSPKCDQTRLRRAIEHANKIAYVATPSGKSVLANSVSMQHAISLSSSTNDPLRCDEQCPAPIYNYSRFISWACAVEDICDAFCLASGNGHTPKFVAANVNKEMQEAFPRSNPQNRMDALGQVDAICPPIKELMATRECRWPHGIWPRVLVASLFAVCLQWGPTSAAVVIVWFLPTVGMANYRLYQLMLTCLSLSGLGCRSAAYLSYGVLSTMSWMIIAFSSLLPCWSMAARPSYGIANQTSIVLRRLGKTIAIVNAMWIVVLCLLQFGNVFDQCYCNSSVLSLGERAIAVFVPSDDEVAGVYRAWIGGGFLGAGSTIICGVSVSLLSVYSRRLQVEAPRHTTQQDLDHPHDHREPLRILQCPVHLSGNDSRGLRRDSCKSTAV